MVRLVLRILPGGFRGGRVPLGVPRLARRVFILGAPAADVRPVDQRVVEVALVVVPSLQLGPEKLHSLPNALGQGYLPNVPSKFGIACFC